MCIRDRRHPTESPAVPRGSYLPECGSHLCPLCHSSPPSAYRELVWKKGRSSGLASPPNHFLPHDFIQTPDRGQATIHASQFLLYVRQLSGCEIARNGIVGGITC